jgi:phosphotransferase system HPr-like phosphotransfer protein
MNTALTPVAREVRVNVKGGLHSRPAAAIVGVVQSGMSTVTVRFGDAEATLRSWRTATNAQDRTEILRPHKNRGLLALLGLGAPEGATLSVTAVGPDAERVLEAISDSLKK